jgi:hypothetical protein
MMLLTKRLTNSGRAVEVPNTVSGDNPSDKPGLYNFRQFEKQLFEPDLAARLISDAARAKPAIAISTPPAVRFTAVASAKGGIRAAKVVVEGSSELSEASVYIDGHFDRALPANGKIAAFDFTLPDLGAAVGDHRIRRASRTFAGISCIRPRAAWEFRPSTGLSRRYGSSFGAR